MLPLTRFIVLSLDKAARYLHKAGPEHLDTGRRGELEAYFHLCGLGYSIVERNFRTAFDHGEVDLIGWDNGVLCFIEVKTRSRAGLVPPEMAVNAAKKRHIRSVARRYIRQLGLDRPPICRFDVISVVFGDKERNPAIRLHKGAFGWKPNRSADANPERRYDGWRR